MNQVLAQGVKIIVTVGHFPLRLTCRPVVEPPFAGTEQQT
jgi:hypothetical protein